MLEDFVDGGRGVGGVAVGLGQEQLGLGALRGGVEDVDQRRVLRGRGADVEVRRIQKALHSVYRPPGLKAISFIVFGWRLPN